MENIVTEKKIQDIEEFSKLNKINVPVTKHFDYYISVLKKTKEYNNLDNTISDFCDLEKYANALGYSSAKSYKLDYALPKIIKYIEGTEVYDSIQNGKFPDSEKLYTKDSIKNNLDSNSLFVSFDIKKANFSAFKIQDQKNEMKESWEELCAFLDIHPTLSKSKSFRQVVFGNLNPKRVQKLQHVQIIFVIQYLKLKGLSEDNICFISHDEFVLKFNKADENDVWQIANYTSEKSLIDISKQMLGMPVRYNIYGLEKIKKDIFVKQMYQKTEKGLVPEYKTLFGAPGNKFYKYFKFYVLSGEIDDRDLFFINDGEIAKWAISDDSIESSFCPEGEMSLDEVKENYKYFFDQLSKEIPVLSDSQKRKIINITKSLCGVCLKRDKQCMCHLGIKKRQIW